jgi:hypothetical protein
MSDSNATHQSTSNLSQFDKVPRDGVRPRFRCRNSAQNAPRSAKSRLDGEALAPGEAAAYAVHHDNLAAPVEPVGPLRKARRQMGEGKTTIFSPAKPTRLTRPRHAQPNFHRFDLLTPAEITGI